VPATRIAKSRRGPPPSRADSAAPPDIAAGQLPMFADVPREPAPSVDRRERRREGCEAGGKREGTE
jgi:hypothetical protein